MRPAGAAGVVTIDALRCSAPLPARRPLARACLPKTSQHEMAATLPPQGLLAVSRFGRRCARCEPTRAPFVFVQVIPVPKVELTRAAFDADCSNALMRDCSPALKFVPVTIASLTLLTPPGELRAAYEIGFTGKSARTTQ